MINCQSRSRKKGQTVVEYFGILAILGYWMMLSIPYLVSEVTNMTTEINTAIEMAAGGQSYSGGGDEGSGNSGNNGNGAGPGNNRSGGGDGTNPGGGGNDQGTDNPGQGGGNAQNGSNNGSGGGPIQRTRGRM